MHVIKGGERCARKPSLAMHRGFECETHVHVRRLISEQAEIAHNQTFDCLSQKLYTTGFLKPAAFCLGAATYGLLKRPNDEPLPLRTETNKTISITIPFKSSCPLGR